MLLGVYQFIQTRSPANGREQGNEGGLVSLPISQPRGLLSGSIMQPDPGKGVRFPLTEGLPN